ncbi:MAG: CRISPR-associated endonuclease Cas3'' [Sulfolobales archaeon]
MGLASEMCRGSYIAGCNKEYKDLCCETMEDHVGSMLEAYRSLDDVVKSSIRGIYGEYIDLVKALANTSNANIDLEGVADLQSCDPVELVIAFHDLGKCTRRSQESLRNRCTAPNHEIVSAASLYAFSISINKDFGFIVVLPHIMAILLHHHPIRSIKDILSSVSKIKLFENSDSPSVIECAKISLDKACPVLAKYVSDAKWTSNISKLINELSKIINFVENLRKGNNPIAKEIPLLVYRIAVMITGIISVLDRYAASINRSCGRISEEHLDKDVSEYFRRRRAFAEASNALSARGI